MNVRRILHASLCLLLLPLVANAHDQLDARPNVILIFCDDLGAFDLGCTGSAILKTPHIDQLRAQGMLFTQAYSSACVCAPSRCALLTGRSLAHAQLRDNAEVANAADGTFGGQRALAAQTETIARVLQRAGYATACFGKWGLGGPGESTGHPLSQGFDRFYGFLCQRNAHNQYAAYLESDREKVLLEGNNRSATGAQFVPDLCAEEAVRWINAKAASDAPFFLYYATNLPHLALQAPQEAVDRYAFEELAYNGKKSYLACAKPRATYAAMVSKIDEAVGRIVQSVTDAGAMDKTIFFFTSDNGAPWALGGFDPDFFASNKGLRGSKCSLWEGGIRVPFIASWKGHVPLASTCAEPVVGYDIFPTILAMTGVQSQAAFDGTTLSRVILGEAPCASLASRAPIVWENPSGAGQQAVRDGRWKLVRVHAKSLERAKFELFDLHLDAAESRNVAAANPEVVARLSKVLQARSVSDLAEWNYAPIPTIE